MTADSKGMTRWVLHPPYPARGRKHMGPRPPTMTPLVPSYTILTPQGDGNLLAPRLVRRPSLSVLHPPYPARGRKPWQTRRVPGFGITVLHPPYPARGRKHFQWVDTQAMAIGSYTLLTPQGDGNTRRLEQNNTRIKSLTPSLPRKGTETQFLQVAAYCKSSQSYTLLTPQGDGNTVVNRGSSSLLMTCLTPSLPRKGTETCGHTHNSKSEVGGLTPSLPRKGTETITIRPKTNS